MSDIEGLQQQVENVSNRLDAALHKLAEYQRVVAGAVRFGVYEKDNHWWYELCRLEQEQAGGLTPDAADGAEAGGFCECSVPDFAPFIECVNCGKPLRS